MEGAIANLDTIMMMMMSDSSSSLFQTTMMHISTNARSMTKYAITHRTGTRNCTVGLYSHVFLSVCSLYTED